MTYIGNGRRFVAWVLDSLVTALFWIPFAETTSEAGQYSVSWRGWDFAIPALLTLAYFVLLEALAGATIGKAVLGIRVRSLDGSRIGIAPALARNAARAVDAFPYVVPYLVGGIAVARSDHKQRLGDRWAKTVVVLVGTDRVPSLRPVPTGRAGAPVVPAMPPAPPPRVEGDDTGRRLPPPP